MKQKILDSTIVQYQGFPLRASICVYHLLMFHSPSSNRTWSFTSYPALREQTSSQAFTSFWY